MVISYCVRIGKLPCYTAVRNLSPFRNSAAALTHEDPTVPPYTIGTQRRTGGANNPYYTTSCTTYYLNLEM